MGGTMGTDAPPERTSGWRSLELLLPVLAMIVLLIVFVGLAQRLALVGSWDRTYGPAGTFLVGDCTLSESIISTGVECDGELRTLADGAAQRSTLAGPLAAFGSEPPTRGSAVEVYHRAGDKSRSFPTESEGVEFVRVLVGVVPRILIAGGLISWLIGWAVTRGISTTEAERNPDRYAWPRRFILRSRGATWTLVGMLLWLVDRMMIDSLLGTAGLV